MHPLKKNVPCIWKKAATEFGYTAFPVAGNHRSEWSGRVDPAAGESERIRYNVRANERAGEAAWQIRFQENAATAGFTGCANGAKGNAMTFPLKRRILVASSSFDLLRVETDLIVPRQVGTPRDHLTVDYGR